MVKEVKNKSLRFCIEEIIVQMPTIMEKKT